MLTLANVKRLERMADRRVAQTSPVLARLKADPASVFTMAGGMVGDAWQLSLLRSPSSRVLLLAGRQCGKSTACAALCLVTALTRPGSLSLVFSPSMRQSSELLRKITQLYGLLGRPVAAVHESVTALTLANGARVLSLPDSETTTRGFSAPSLVLVDEASRVSDELFTSIGPMMATNPAAKLILLSTPAGRRGQFYELWESGDGWQKLSIRADQCDRIPKSFLEEQRRTLGPMLYAQEMENQWLDLQFSLFAPGDIDAALANNVQPLW